MALLDAQVRGLFLLGMLRPASELLRLLFYLFGMVGWTRVSFAVRTLRQ